MADKKMISRLKIVVKEAGGQRKFAKIAEVNHSTVSLMLSGKREVSLDIILVCSVSFGYTPEWLILGTGDRKQPGKDSVKLITEIQYFRTELEIANKRIDLAMARINGLQKELDEYKKTV